MTAPDDVAPPVHDRSMASSICISCDDCRLQQTDACTDCVVAFLLGAEPDQAVIIDAAEARGLRLLSNAGLAPALRHQRRVG